MKQNTKETIGPRGTLAGFRPLIGEERWMLDTYTQRHLHGFLRPLLHGEGGINKGMLYPVTLAPLPPPQVETFEAHGHVWYRHVPGDACPVEADVTVVLKFMEGGYTTARASILRWSRSESYTIIGYRFPDFPAVHTTLQQQKPAVQQPGTTKQRLATMYHGWCDVAPDSVAECIADVAKVLYPTDADRCEAEFQKWLDQRGHPGMDVGAASEAWDAAWNAAKQQKP